MSKFKTGDEIVRTKGDYNWAPLGYKAIVLKGYFYIDALGKSNNEVADDFWELAEDTSKPVTFTSHGKIYELDKEYLFGNDGINLVYGRLVSICAQSSYPFQSDSGKLYKYIGMLSNCKDQGTITPAPIDLIDGNAYMFNINGTWVGFYRECRNCFFTQLVNGNKIASVNECTNIRPMTVAESK
jgi:hypothetical protein